jgi:hypothetical protein
MPPVSFSTQGSAFFVPCRHFLPKIGLRAAVHHCCKEGMALLLLQITF